MATAVAEAMAKTDANTVAATKQMCHAASLLTQFLVQCYKNIKSQMYTPKCLCPSCHALLWRPAVPHGHQLTVPWQDCNRGSQIFPRQDFKTPRTQGDQNKEQIKDGKEQ